VLDQIIVTVSGFRREINPIHIPVFSFTPQRTNAVDNTL